MKSSVTQRLQAAAAPTGVLVSAISKSPAMTNEASYLCLETRVLILDQYCFLFPHPEQLLCLSESHKK